MTGDEIGAILTADGTTLNLSKHDRTESILIIAKIRDLNTGTVSVSIAHTSDVDTVTRIGMITAAADIIRGTSTDWHQADDEDDEP